MSFKRGPIELRQGDWREVLLDVTADAVITDPPYSERTHAGERGLRLEPAKRVAHGESEGLARCPRNAIAYEHITPEACAEFFKHWATRSRNWFALFSDHIAFNFWEAAAQSAGLCTFAPVIWLKKAAPPRFSGDGPANWAEYLLIARPRRKPAIKGSRPGAYHACTQTGRLDDMGGSGIIGRKDVQAMRALVRDYTSPGDLVCDPYAGSGSTLLAAAIEGRRAIGAEVDPETFDKACERINRGYTPDLFGGA